MDKHSKEHATMGMSSLMTLFFFKENEVYYHFHKPQNEVNLSVMGSPTANPP